MVIPVSSGSVAIVDATEETPSMLVKIVGHQERASNLSFGAPCMTALAIMQRSMNETYVRGKKSAAENRPGDIHCNLAGRHQALVAQGIVDETLSVSVKIKVKNLSNSYK